MSRDWSYRVWDKREKTYSDKAFSIDQLGICYVQDEDGYWEEIDEERYIVEQSTGLEDKNGKMIREGDIVRVSYGYNYEVRQFKSGAWRIGRDDLCVWADSSEVIGNIHENPELLEGEK